MKEVLTKEFPNILIHTAKDHKMIGVDHKEAIIIKKDNNEENNDNGTTTNTNTTTSDNNSTNTTTSDNNKTNGSTSNVQDINTDNSNSSTDVKRFKVKVTFNDKNKSNYKINNKN